MMREGVVQRTRPILRVATISAILAVTLVASACSGSSPATIPADSSGIGTRTLSLDLSGSTEYERTATITGGSVRVAYASNGAVDTIGGTVTFPGAASGTASATFALRQQFGSFSGQVTVSDPSAGVNAVVAHTFVSIPVDGDGDASATASAAGLTLAWSITTVAAPGLEPVLDELTAEEDAFCQDAQQRLTGLDEATLPVASVGNVLHTSRGAFGSSKATLNPLQVQTWSEPGMATTAEGNTVALTHRISCKTRSADHVATTGLPTSPDRPCRDLNQRSLDLALDRLTPAQLSAYQASGRPVVLQPDVVEQTGVDWLTPIADEVATGGALNLTAHALLVNWQDPAFAIFPETIRGVHYCTVWSPAWAYWYLTVGAFIA